MALARHRKSELIIIAASILRRAPSDKLIHDAGGSTEGYPFVTMNAEETRFVEELLENTIVVTARDPQTGALHVAPR